jgi:hypothetical protein
VDFFCCDLPECNTLNLAIFAAKMAQHESELISRRTKAALQAKKKREGIEKLHNNLTPERREKGYRHRRSLAQENPANQRAWAAPIPHTLVLAALKGAYQNTQNPLLRLFVVRLTARNSKIAIFFLPKKCPSGPCEC